MIPSIFLNASGCAVAADQGPRRWLLGLALHHLPRVVLAGLFVWSGAIKFADPAGFGQIVLAYDVLPPAWVSPTAILLPGLEWGAAGGLLLSMRWRQAGAVLTIGMLCVFMAAIASAWWRGLDVSCGCFTTEAHAGDDGNISTLGPLLLARNSVLVLLAAMVLHDFTGRRGRLMP